MEPQEDEKRLGWVGIPVSGAVDRRLPPPPQLASTGPAGRYRPRYRLLAPGTFLVISVPVATWHLIGHQTVDDAPLHIYKAPRSLAYLDPYVGWSFVGAAFAALVWLALEYWRRSWRGEWFAFLGLLSALGLYWGIGGRVVTAGVDGANFGGGFFLVGAPGTHLAAFLAIGLILRRIAASPIGPRPSLFLLRSGAALLAIAAAASCCAMGYIAVRILSPHPETTWDESVSSLVGMVFVTALSMVFLVFCLMACVVVWAIFFGSADWAKGRLPAGSSPSQWT